MVVEEGDAGRDRVPQCRLARGRQPVDPTQQRVGVTGEVDEDARLAVEAHEGDLVVGLLAADELAGRRLCLVELAVLIHRARGVDDEHDANRRVRARQGDGAELVDELAVLPEVDVSQIRRGAVVLGRDGDLGELGGVDLLDEQLIGERRTRPRRHDGEDEGEDGEESLQVNASRWRAC